MPNPQTYTTGALAKACGISVRTVQYYDARGLLPPSALSEGGRRIYSETDLRRMKIICFLRECNMSLDEIKSLFKEPHPEQVITLMLEAQAHTLREEIEEKEARIATVVSAKRALAQMEACSLDALGDVADLMAHQKKLRRLRILLVVLGLPGNLIEYATLAIGLLYGIWWPFALGLCLVLLIGFSVVDFYLKRVRYLCPACHTAFAPRYRQAVFASHTPATRRLTCPNCGHRGSCIEIYREEN